MKIDWCKFGIHEYGKWQVIEIGEITRFGRVVGRYLYQQRKCELCGYEEIDSQKEY